VAAERGLVTASLRLAGGASAVITNGRMISVHDPAGERGVRWWLVRSTSGAHL
jgi:hypothetical protein